MLKITIDGKKYRIVQAEESIVGNMEYYIKRGFLQEVKEESEEKQDNSMIAKIREEIEDLIQHWQNVPVKQRAYRDVLGIIDSLTPSRGNHSEGNTPENIDSSHKLLYKEKWRPEKGKEIEVSNDGEKWEKKVFQHMDITGTLFRTEFEGLGFQNTTFKYARPIPKPELPDFEWSEVEESKIRMTAIGEQVEAITKFLKQK